MDKQIKIGDYIRTSIDNKYHRIELLFLMDKPGGYAGEMQSVKYVTPQQIKDNYVCLHYGNNWVKSRQIDIESHSEEDPDEYYDDDKYDDDDSEWHEKYMISKMKNEDAKMNKAEKTRMLMENFNKYINYTNKNKNKNKTISEEISKFVNVYTDSISVELKKFGEIVSYDADMGYAFIKSGNVLYIYEHNAQHKYMKVSPKEFKVAYVSGAKYNYDEFLNYIESNGTNFDE